MKIMIVGTCRWSIYEEAFARGLVANGAEASLFPISPYFKGFFGHIQEAIPFLGTAIVSINLSVVSAVKKLKPDLILFWRPTHILPITIKRLRKLGVKLCSYNNDDPFGPKVHGKVPWHHHFLWHWYIRILPLMDYNFFYRKINCEEAIAYGAKHAELLLPYFIPWRDYPIQLTPTELQHYETDVVFVGHYEPDDRVNYIRALINAGIKFKLWGGKYWSREVLGDLYDVLAPIKLAEGVQYGKALTGAKVCLCFLSKMNRDTYTRRCFEIPAYGKVMLAERTEDLLQFFKEDEEACFFSNTEELVSKTQWLINNPDIRERIAYAGFCSVWRGRHDVVSRAKDFLTIVS